MYLNFKITFFRHFVSVSDAHRFFTIHLLQISVCVPAFVLSELSAYLFYLARLKTPIL